MGGKKAFEWYESTQNSQQKGESAKHGSGDNQEEKWVENETKHTFNIHEHKA